MAGKRERPEEIVSKLRQVEVLHGQGATIAEAVRQIGGEAFKPPLVRGERRTSRRSIDGASCMAGWAGLSSPGSRSLRRRTSGCVARCLT
jgi:hypothetical protein